MRGDEGRLCDQEGAGSAAALPVVLLHIRERDVLKLSASEAGEGRKDDAVGKRQIADLDWLEEFGDCGGGHDGGDRCCESPSIVSPFYPERSRCFRAGFIIMDVER